MENDQGKSLNIVNEYKHRIQSEKSTISDLHNNTLLT